MSVRPRVGGPRQPGSRFCSPVSCLLLMGPMQELDPHLHPAEAQREELGCHELSQDSGSQGEQERTSQGQRGSQGQ